MNDSIYRHLTETEIDVMTANGCSATDWHDVMVAETFDASCCSNVTFSGRNTLGRLDGWLTADGISYPAGIRNARLHDCAIGDGCAISNVADIIAGCRIGSRVIITGVGAIIDSHDSSYGIGEHVDVLNETGGRSVPLSTVLTAQTAYMLAMYRHDAELINALTHMVMEQDGDTSLTIADDAVVRNCTYIRDVRIGRAASITGARKICCATIDSTPEHPAIIEAAGSMRHFVMQPGARVLDGVIVDHALIGRHATLADGVTVHHSLVFANSQLFCGEVVASFCGPFTVSMHKSSLLIAGMFSYFNAGSGTNQSNHMYKVGPVHAGITGRGCKTSSDAYIAWPARIGEFTFIAGRHYGHPDTSALPFSYLVESGGKSLLIPAANLFTAGTARDNDKWPKRNRLSAAEPDCITTDVFNPASVGRILDAIDLLGSDTQWRGFDIAAHHIERAIADYRAAAHMYVARLIKSCTRDVSPISSRWIDLGGLIAPSDRVRSICEEIKAGVLPAAALSLRLHDVANDEARLRTWAVYAYERLTGKAFVQSTDAEIEAFVAQGRQYADDIARRIADDAEKDFGDFARIGFGIDDPSAADADFAAVRPRPGKA